MHPFNALKQTHIDAQNAASALIRAHLAAATAEGRAFTPEEQKTQEAAIAQVEELGRMIAAEESRRADELAVMDARRGVKHPGLVEASGKKTFAVAFQRESLGTDGWKSFEDYLNTIASGLSHPSLRAAAREGQGSLGGFFVPEQYVATLLDLSLEAEIVRPRCQFVPMISDTAKAPGFDAQDNSGQTLLGGVTAAWLGESQSITESAPKTRMVVLTARKLAIFTKVPNELVADGVGYEQTLGRKLIEAIGWFLDYACLNGTGSGQPLGVLNDPALITVAKEGGQTGGTIVYDNLVKMFSRLHPASVKRAIWVANPTTIPQLAKLSVPVGTGGSHIPVMRESDGGFEILTRPVIFTEKVPAVGSKGDIGLYDFSQYACGLRAEVTLEKSAHVGFQTDETAYRTLLRGDCRGLWSKAFTPANGQTLSWAVTLEAR